MAEHTEIYLCKTGQNLDQAKIDFAQHVMARHEAEQDAIKRCEKDASLVKLVYYVVNDTGKFRSIFSYENAASTASRATSTPRAHRSPNHKSPTPSANFSKRPRSILMRGLMSIFTEEAR